jgi:hypothetical protein
MSGQCTGWVLRHGPKDRAMRAVLITIADAANRDGENSHPGRDAMVEGSGYSRATVTEVLRRLEDEGWIEVTERGRGRGHATTYRVPMVVPEKGQPLAPSIEEKGPVQPEKRASLDPEKGQSGEPTLLLFNGSYNGSTNGPPPSAPATEVPARRDPLFDAVVEACAIAVGDLTPSARGGLNRALAELRQAGADPLEVPHRAAVYRARFPQAVLTPNALAKHWPTCAVAPPPPAPRRGSVGDDTMSAATRYLQRVGAER